MSAFDGMLNELAVMAEHREGDRRANVIDQEIDAAIASGAPGLHVARLEAIRNRVATTPRIWQGNGA